MYGKNQTAYDSVCGNFLPFFDTDKITAADVSQFGQFFLRQLAIQTGISDCLAKKFMYVIHYSFTFLEILYRGGEKCGMKQ